MRMMMLRRRKRPGGGGSGCEAYGADLAEKLEEPVKSGQPVAAVEKHTFSCTHTYIREHTIKINHFIQQRHIKCQ